MTASSTFCLSKKISSRLKNRDSNFRQHSVRHSVSCLPFDDGSVFATLYEVFSAAGTGRSQCLILGDSSCVAGLPRVLLRSLSLRVLVLDVTGSGEDAEHRPVPRRAHGAHSVSAPHENQLDGRGGRRHLRAHPSRLHPSARCRDVSSCRVNPFVHPTYSCSAGCWVHSPRTGVPLPGPHSAPLFVSRSPKERARASGRSRASLREPALWISAPCLLRKTVAFAGAVNRNAASVNTPLRSPKPQ